MQLTKKQKSIAVLLFIIIMVPLPYLLVTLIGHFKSPAQEQPIRNPNQVPVITLPDNVVQNRIDIWQLSINDAGILTIDMNMTLDDGFYYVTAEFPVKGTTLKFKDYHEALGREVE